ncbi:MAG TPA: hypothetical protein VGM03_24640 [Phycisphaerae bacterium]|jgi:hypothetical protein
MLELRAHVECLGRWDEDSVLAVSKIVGASVGMVRGQFMLAGYALRAIAAIEAGGEPLSAEGFESLRAQNSCALPGSSEWQLFAAAAFLLNRVDWGARPSTKAIRT